MDEGRNWLLKCCEQGFNILLAANYFCVFDSSAQRFYLASLVLIRQDILNLWGVKSVRIIIQIFSKDTRFQSAAAEQHAKLQGYIGGYAACATKCAHGFCADKLLHLVIIVGFYTVSGT